MLSVEEKLLELFLVFDPKAEEDPVVRDSMRTAGLTEYVMANAEEAGSVLRQLRHERDLSLREAGDLVGVSYSAVGRLERGDRKGGRRPSIGLVRELADAYEVEIDRMLRRFGVFPVGGQLVHPSEPWVRQKFENLVLRKGLRPSMLKQREELDWISDRVQEAWLEFAELLEAHVRAGGPSVREMQSEPIADADDDEEGAGD